MFLSSTPYKDGDTATTSPGSYSVEEESQELTGASFAKAKKVCRILDLLPAEDSVHDMSGVEPCRTNLTDVLQDADDPFLQHITSIFQSELEKAMRCIDEKIDRVGLHLAERIDKLQYVLATALTSSRTAQDVIGDREPFNDSLLDASLNKAHETLVPSHGAIRRESDNRPNSHFRCDLCQLKFLYSSGLSTHNLLKHSYTKRIQPSQRWQMHKRGSGCLADNQHDHPFQCSICLETFKKAKVCVRHVKKTHGCDDG